MGTENSKPEKHTASVRNLNNGHTDMAIKQALEQQRKIYEEKLEKLVKSQLQSKTTVPHNPNQNSKTPSMQQNATSLSIGSSDPNMKVISIKTTSNRQTVHDLHQPSVANTIKFEVRNVNNVHRDMLIKQDLEQQRKMYEEKLEKYLESQLQSETKVAHNHHQNSNAPSIQPNPTSSSVGSLDPNSKVISFKTTSNRPTVHHDLHQPSVSNTLKFEAQNVNNGHTDMAIKQALEQQQKMNEEKLEKLVKSQLQSKTTVPHNPNQNSKIPSMQQNPTSSSVGSLDPNSKVISFKTTSNRPTVHHDLHQPSVSNTLKFDFSPAVPSAPVESFNDVDVTSKKIYNKGAIPKSRTFTNQKRKTNDNQSVNCVTCSGTLGLQIYQCNFGHSSCSQCRLFNKHCGICSKLITDMRNITLEAFIADLQIKNNDDVSVKCPNTKDGCCLSFKKVAMEEHIQECPYKDLECPLLEIFGTCKWRGKINNLLQHFKDVHPEHCFADVDKEMKILDTETQFHNVYFVNIGSFNFLIHIKQDNKKTLYMTAALYGTKFSASKWMYEFHVYNKREPKRKFTYIDICNPFVTPVIELLKVGQCAVLDQQYAKTFFNNNELNYKFYMKKNVDSKKNMH